MDITAAYVDLLQVIQDATRLGRSTLHIHAGLAIYFLSQMVLSDRRASVLGLAWVAFLATMNEVVEAIHFQDPRWPDTLGDMVTTLFWPTVIVVMGRYRRYRWTRQQAAVVRDRAPIARRKLNGSAAASAVPERV